MEEIRLEVLSKEDDAHAVEFCRKIYEEMGWSLEGLGPSLIDEYKERGDFFLVAKQGGEIVGTGSLQKLSEKEVVMKKLYVAPELRGSGLALRLYNELVEKARGVGYDYLVLDVSSDNTRAIAFYQKQKMEEYTATPHPRWYESAHDQQATHRYFRINLSDDRVI